MDVSAPGAGVISTFWDGTYVAWSGTSFATAIVSAEAALIISKVPGLRNDRLVDLIEDHGRSIDAQNPQYRGKLGDSGIIDIDAAVAAARRR
jgi:subtilisin family serine protease